MANELNYLLKCLFNFDVNQSSTIQDGGRIMWVNESHEHRSCYYNNCWDLGVDGDGSKLW